ncbi:MAG: N-acetyltransferase [Opitutaceae bacterium]
MTFTLDTLPDTVRIREAQSSDAPDIRGVHLAAFGDEGPLVADLALELMADKSAEPMLVLVAESEKGVVGSIIFSSVRIPGAKSGPSYLLAPLAVAPEFQHMGVGKQLIESGLTALRERGGELIFVLGDPRYYSRFGFSAEHKVRAPYDLPYPDAWMCRPLGKLVPELIEGQLACAESLKRPEHW